MRILRQQFQVYRFFKFIMQPDKLNNNPSHLNTSIKRNQLVFSIAMIALQILASVLYGNFVQIPQSLINIGSILTTIFIFFLVVIGFGLFFSIFKNLIWNGLGFSLLITALSIELYPLMNALWAKASIYSNNIFSDSFKIKHLSLYLSNTDNAKYQNNTITAAIKCALAIIIAFGAVIGRIGPLETLIMTVVGVFGYELNRNICINLGQDAFGTYSIFAFGGFLGLTLAIFMMVRQRRGNVLTQGNSQLTSSRLISVTCMIGSIFLFVFFPFLAFEGDQSLQASNFHRYLTPISIILSMGSSMLSSFAISMLIHGDKSSCIRIKDIANSVVAGGITAGAASFYITAPYLAIIIGSISGMLQYWFDNWFQRAIFRRLGLITTSSFSLFCLQSFLGAVFAAAYNSRVTNITKDGFAFNSNLKTYGYQFAIYFISSGFGIACGIISGFPCYFLNNYTSKDVFHDKIEFTTNDGMSYIKKHDQGKTDPNIKNSQKGEGLRQNEGHLGQNRIDSVPADPSDYSDQQFSFDFADMMQVVVQ